MHPPAFVFTMLFFFGVTVAQAAGVKTLTFPPARRDRRSDYWSGPPARAPQEMDGRGAIFLAVPGMSGHRRQASLIVMSHGRRGWFGGHHDTAAALADAGFVVTALRPSRRHLARHEPSPTVFPFL